ncbi:uncharacterized protein LOC125556699 [Nematostella vectensis]|uniref:uncharacterized protein LOC125556699 n=1 Tax=Nematostella vectensis TaxID=45351 RepID=UPI002077906B|nr:uncharacterized protein LOC125556699 [Nematostella vectensis]
MARMVSKKTPTLLSLFRDRKKVYNRFFAPNLEQEGKLCASSLVTYSCSLESFLEYMQSVLQKDVTPSMRQDLMATKEAQKSWRSSWKQQVKVRKEKKNWEMEDKIPTIQEISALVSSDHSD